MTSQQLRTFRFIITRLVSVPIVLLLIVVIADLLSIFSPGGLYDTLRANGQANGLTWMWPTIQQSIAQVFSFHFSNIRSDVFYQACGITLLLSFGSIFIACLFGIPIGILAAIRRGSWWTDGLAALSVLVCEVPPASMAVILLIVFGLMIPILPIMGWDSPASAVLPMMALACINIGYVVKYTQSSVSEIMQRDFILSAKARGLTQAKVVLRHALRPSMVSLVTFFGPQATMTVFYSVAVERVFDIPGMGTMLGWSVSNLGTPNMYGGGSQALATTFFIFGLITTVLNLVIDVTYRFLNPTRGDGA